MRPRPPVIEGRIVLPDDRRLGFAEFGVPTGKPVFWFHGTPGARRQTRLRRVWGRNGSGSA